jgi:hypothetical protein
MMMMAVNDEKEHLFYRRKTNPDLLPAAFRRVVYTDATSSSISYHGS